MSDPSDPDTTGAYQPAPPTALAGERFAPGALLAGRYRIVAAPRPRRGFSRTEQKK